MSTSVDQDLVSVVSYALARHGYEVTHLSAQGGIAATGFMQIMVCCKRGEQVRADIVTTSDDGEGE